MEEKTKDADPNLIVAVQMLSIGIILIILGVTVFILSPISTMDPYIRICSVLSNGSITLMGVFFAIGGFIRYKRAKKKE